MTLTTNVNYLQPTGYKLVINHKRFGNLQYFAQSVSHPNVSISAAPVPFSRVNVHFGGDKLTFGELGASIILDEDMTAYTEIFNWVKFNVENNNKVGSMTEQNSASDITVNVLSSNNNTLKSIRYHDCVPTDIGGVEFVSTAADVQYLTFNVSFAFSYFEIV